MILSGTPVPAGALPSLHLEKMISMENVFFPNRSPFWGVGLWRVAFFHELQNPDPEIPDTMDLFCNTGAKRPQKSALTDPFGQRIVQDRVHEEVRRTRGGFRPYRSG